MSEIKDASLFKSGYDKINWVKNFMPVLSKIQEEFEQTRPFEGKKISMSIHLEAKTAYLAQVLRSGGASVSVTGCNPLSTQDDVAAALVDDGFEVFAIHGVGEEGYTKNLKQALEHCPDVIIDDGGDFTNLLHGECPQYAKNLIGGCEETTTGIARLRVREKNHNLNFTMISVNDADCKHLFDNRYGTGQSTWDAIMNTTNLIVAGKNVVVAGYGWCGKGVAMRAKGLGARVIVTEINPVKAIEAVMDGFDVMKMEEAAAVGDVFVTVTGCADVITKKHIKLMKNGAILANTGHFDVEINKIDLESLAIEVEQKKPNIVGYKLANGNEVYLLAEGRLVNLAAGNGHPAEIMDMSFSIQAKCLEYLVKNGSKLKNNLYYVPEEIDAYVAGLKISAMGFSVDTLTEEQKKYLYE